MSKKDSANKAGAKNKAASAAPAMSSDENQKLYMALKQEIDKRDLSNTENHDKAILTYSSLGLTISLTFLKDVTPLECVSHEWALFTSWVLFLAAIITVIFSFFLSQSALHTQLKNAEDYYLGDDDSALNRTNPLGQLTKAANILSAIFFVLAVVCAALFCYLNVNNQLIKLRNQETVMCTHQPKDNPPKTIKEGATTPELIKKGANPPTIQPKPSQNNGSSGAGNTQKK